MAAFADLQQQLTKLAPVKGIAPVDILGLPDAVAAAVRKMMRGGMTLTELAGELDLPPHQARQIGDLLVEKGFLTSQGEESGGILYRVYFARMRGHNIPAGL